MSKFILCWFFIVGASFAAVPSYAKDIDPVTQELLNIIKQDQVDKQKVIEILLENNKVLIDNVQSECKKKSLKERLFGG